MPDEARRSCQRWPDTTTTPSTQHRRITLFTITRRTLHLFRIVARKALNIHRGVVPPIVIEPADDGLRLRICSEEAAVDLLLPGDSQGERMCVPFELLDIPTA